MSHCSKSPLNNYTEILFNIYTSQRLILFQELQETGSAPYKSDLDQFLFESEKYPCYHIVSYYSSHT